MKYNEIILTGDFNCNYFSPNCETKKFLTVIDNFSFHIVNVFEPTYFPSKGQCSLLDLAITNTDKIQFFNQISVGFADHDFLFFSYDTHKDIYVDYITFRNFKAIDTNKLFNDCLCSDWSSMYNYVNVDDIVETFNSIILKLFEDNVPISKIKSQSLYPPWFNDEIESGINLRDYVLSLWKRKKRNEYLIEFRKLRNRVTALIRRAKTIYFNDYLISKNEKPGKFWSKIKKLGLGKSNDTTPDIDPDLFCNYITVKKVASSTLKTVLF